MEHGFQEVVQRAQGRQSNHHKILIFVFFAIVVIIIMRDQRTLFYLIIIVRTIFITAHEISKWECVIIWVKV